jgi:hypothetical protein
LKSKKDKAAEDDQREVKVKKHFLVTQAKLYSKATIISLVRGQNKSADGIS